MSDSYDDYESKMQLAEHVWEVKTEHDRAVELAKAYERGWNAALAQQEPVAWITDGGKGELWWHRSSKFDEEGNLIGSNQDDIPLYTAPPKKEWVGLTDEEVMVAAYRAGFDIHEDYDSEDDPEKLHWWSADGETCNDSLLKLRDFIEAKLKEKNT
jgi:hypothetical protein